MLTTSKHTGIALETKLELFISSIISNIWQVSLICDGNLLANSNKTFSTKMDKFSTSVLQPLVITLTGLFSLCLNITIYLSSHGAKGTKYATIRNKGRYMEKAIRPRHSRKLLQDKITKHHNIDNKKRKDQRFSKKQLINKKKLKRVRHKNNYRERIHFAKVNGPDQTAINL